MDNHARIPQTAQGFMLKEVGTGKVTSMPITYAMVPKLLAMLYPNLKPNTPIGSWEYSEEVSSATKSYTGMTLNCTKAKGMFYFVQAIDNKSNKVTYVKPNSKNTPYYKDLVSGDYYYF